MTNETPDKKRKPTTVYINPYLWQLAKHRAVDEETTASQVIEAALRVYLGVNKVSTSAD